MSLREIECSGCYGKGHYANAGGRGVVKCGKCLGKGKSRSCLFCGKCTTRSADFCNVNCQKGVIINE